MNKNLAIELLLKWGYLITTQEVAWVYDAYKGTIKDLEQHLKKYTEEEDYNMAGLCLDIIKIKKKLILERENDKEGKI